MKLKRQLGGKTDYRKRLVFIKSRKPRLVVRRSSKEISAQVIEYFPEGDKIIASATTKELLKLGYTGGGKNIPAAYLLGLLIAKKTNEKSIKEVTPDIGFHAPISGSRVFAVLHGAKEGGLNFSIDKSVVPDIKRLNGEHIVAYAKKEGSKFSHQQDELPKKIEAIKRQLTEK